MISREKLINKIDEAINSEDIGIKIYCMHIKNTFFLSGFEKEMQKKIKSGMDLLRRESEMHKKALEFLKEKIREGKRNVY